MDNFKIDLLAEGFESLADAIQVCFRHNGAPATHWVETPTGERRTPTLVLLWGGNESRPGLTVNPFPAKLYANTAAAHVWTWLEQVPRGSQPDIDGDSHQGWRLYTDGWGHVEGFHCAIVGIQPAWAMYGK